MMKNNPPQTNKERKLTPKDYSLKNGKFLTDDMIHGKGINFLGNRLKN